MEIKIRDWKLEDAPDLANILNNKNIQDGLRDGIPYPYGVSDAENFIKGILDAPKDTIYAWAITCDDILVGHVDISRRDNIHYRTAEMGYYISEAYWGKGIASKAIKDASQFVINNTNILRIFSEPFTMNVPSCRSLENAGFTLECVLRKNAIKNGKVIDMSLYVLIKK